MAAKREFLDHVIETMRDLGAVTGKPMFGGWGLYHEGLFFALIAEDTLYLKTDDENRAEFEAASLQPFVYVTKDGDRMVMGYSQAPAAALEDAGVMAAWARSAYAAALRASQRKPGKRRKATVK